MPSVAVRSKSKGHQVTELTDDQYEVISGGSGKVYRVKVRDYGYTCSCAWGSKKPPVPALEGCSHMQAVYWYLGEVDRVVEIIKEADILMAEKVKAAAAPIQPKPASRPAADQHRRGRDIDLSIIAPVAPSRRPRN